MFNRYLDPDLIVWLVTGSGPDYSMSMPVCNDHGQCATATVDVQHDVGGFRFSYGWYMGLNLGIRQLDVIVDLPNGSQTKTTYSGLQMQSQRAAPGFSLPVPANTAPDAAIDDDCLNNLTQDRPPDSEMTSVDPAGNGDADPYEQWWDEEEAYGGRVPDLRCGVSSVPGGQSTRVCGWFWF